MSDLIVLDFDSEESAMQMRDKLLQLQKMELISLEDAAVVTRHGDGKPKVKQLNSLVGAGALGGAFWGLLIGLLFFAPWLGMAAGALGGAIGGQFTDVGVDDKFIKEVAETIKPGHSALFLLVSKMVEDKVFPEFEAYNATVVQTSLSTEDEAKLKDAFHHETE